MVATTPRLVVEKKHHDSLFLLNLKHEPEEPQDDHGFLIFSTVPDELPRPPAAVDLLKHDRLLR